MHARRFAPVLLCLLTAPALVVTAPASAAPLSKKTAQAAAKQRASDEVEKFGISYPPSMWKADCSRARTSVFACNVGTGGQCSGRLTVYRSAGKVHTRNVQIRCGE